MQKITDSTGIGLPAVLIAVAVLTVGGIITGQLISKKTDNSAVVASVPPAEVELPVFVDEAETTDTMMADDPPLETIDDTDLAADGSTVQALPEVDDEVLVEAPVTDSLPLAVGTYETYSPEKLALAETGEVVLFFHADWCPSCRSLENDINNNLANIPDGVHILKVDYDTATALKKQYGIVRQHTLVQVDESGNAIKTLNGLNNTLNQVVSQI